MTMAHRYAGYLEREADQAATPVKTAAMRQAAQKLRDLERENAQLREALQRATTWGISSEGFDAHTAFELDAWVQNGMQGDLPALAPHLARNES